MKPLLLTTAGDHDAVAAKLEEGWRQGRLVGLAAPMERTQLERALGDGGEAGPGSSLERFGPGVIVGSGGSTGGRRWCLQPLRHLQASAAATGSWLQAQGIDPAACLVLNPLPLHHVSGLLPLVRARQWGAELRWLPAEWMRDPATLLRNFPLPSNQPVVLSLVPTQLHRLMAASEGLKWLSGCSVIWVGGASLSADLINRARQAKLSLAPCYGATETAAMVCALAPKEFLAGRGGCGVALVDVNLRIDARRSAIEVRTSRLTPGWLSAGHLMPPDLSSDGWWRSGDRGRLGGTGLFPEGRLDGAISSGGETVFPEQVEQALRQWALQGGLPLKELLLLPQPDPVWGQRLVALFRYQGREFDAPSVPVGSSEQLRVQLEELAQKLTPSQRPKSWIHCPSLERGGLGKWQRRRWQEWLVGLD